MNHFTRRDFLASAAALAVAPLRATEPRRRFAFVEPVHPPRPVQVMAHRGLAVVAPENTRHAVEACARDFIEWAEIDIRLSKDGEHVVFHDDRLDGKTDGSGPVRDRTLDELRKLDAGAWFAPRFAGTRLLSLNKGLDLARGKVNLYLDCKAVDPGLLVKEVRAAGMERQVIVYGPPRVTAAVRNASGGAVAVMTKYRSNMDFNSFVQTVSPDAVEVDPDQITAELCQKFHAAGIVVQAKVLGEKWDTPPTWRRMIAAGVDWLQTNHPAGVRTVAAHDHFPRRPVAASFHRGANRYAPENTLPAIETAVTLEADYVEIDVRTTKDGKFVLMHDVAVNRTTNGQGKVRDLTLAEIRRLDAGSWFGKPYSGVGVPTLDEALSALGDTAGVYLDAKDIAPEALLAAVKEHGLFDRHVFYQSAGYLATMKKLDARVRPLPPLRSAADLQRLADLKPYAVDASWRALSGQLITSCHARGIKVFSDALGANETVDQYHKAMRWGIDVIQADFPLRLLRAVELL